MMPAYPNYGYGQPVYYNYDPQNAVPQAYGSQQPPQYAAPQVYGSQQPPQYANPSGIK